MMEEEVEILVEVAVLGEQMDHFRRSAVGKHLLKRAEEDYNAGIEELKRVPPADTEAVRTAQNKVRVAESVRDWIEESIASGLRATMILEDREE